MEQYLPIALYQMNTGTFKPSITSARIEVTHLAVPTVQ